MATITYTLTSPQMEELKSALKFHQGLADDPTEDDIKTWGLRQFQGIVQKHRTHVIASESPVSNTAIAT
tara:strand:- start:76 stop:282 length:207 start_codon:yes stop_codon:yes gene_type:complete